MLLCISLEQLEIVSGESLVSRRKCSSSKVDRQAFLDILKVNADLGRLGGLLKLWLSDDVKSFGLSRDVRPVLREVEKRQAEMKPLIEALRKFI